MRILVLALLLSICWSNITQADDRSITVQARGRVEAVPDILSLQVSIKQVAANMQQASQQADAIARQAVAAAMALGIAAEDIDNWQMHSWREYDWRGNKRRYLGEAVQRELQFKLRKPDLYGALVAALSKLDLLHIHPPQTSHSNINDLELAALRAALARGKVKAAAIAEELGVRLGPVRSVTELGGSAAEPPGVMLMDMNNSVESAASAPGFSSAPRGIQARVRMVFATE